MVWFGKVVGPLGGAALQEEAFYLRQPLRTLAVLFLLPECGCHVISQLPTPVALPSLPGGATNSTSLELGARTKLSSIVLFSLQQQKYKRNEQAHTDLSKKLYCGRV